MGGKSSKAKRQPEPVPEPKKEGYKYQHIVIPEADPAPANAEPKVANPPSEAVKNQNQNIGNNRTAATSNQPANNVTIIPRSDAIYPPLPTVNIPPISEETDPYNLALNLSAVSDSFLKLVHAVQNHWDRDNVMTEIHDNIANFEKYTINMRDDRRIRNWIKPVHYRSTGLLIVRSKYTANDLTRIRTIYDQLRSSHDSLNDNSVKREFSDILKSVVGYESVVTADVQHQVQICTDAMGVLQSLDIDNYSKWEINHRKFVLATIKLVRIANLRALQQRNGEVLKELSDMVYNILRATKVFHLVAKKALQDPATLGNLVNLYQAVFDQLRRLEQVLVTVDQLAPDVDRIVMTQDTINEFSDQYTNVIKEVTDALEAFKGKAKRHQAADFEKQVRVVIDCIEVFKRVLVTPNNEAFTDATIRACEAIEKSCVDIYRVMPLELDLTLRELVLYSLQTELHFVFQARIVAAMKTMYYLIAPAEISQFSALRLLLLAKSVLLTHAAIMVTYGDSTLDEFIEPDNSPEHDYRDLTTIWHAGRGLPGLWQDPNAVAPGPSMEEIHKSPTKTAIPVNDDEALDNLMLALGIKGGPVVSSEPEPAADPEPEPVVQTPEKPDKRRKSSLGGKKAKPETPIKTPVMTPEPKNNNNVVTPSKTTSGQKSNKTRKASGTKPMKNSNKSTPATSPTKTSQTTTAAPTSPTKPVVTTTATPNASKIDVSTMMKADLNNIPVGYPTAPAKPVLKPGASNEEYKAYMVQKYEYEEWENRLLLAQRKVAQGLPWQ